MGEGGGGSYEKGGRVFPAVMAKVVLERRALLKDNVGAWGLGRGGNLNAGWAGCLVFIYLFIFSHTSTFQLLDKPWSQVSSLLPPGSCLQFLSRIGFSNPTARRFFIECC